MKEGFSRRRVLGGLAAAGALAASGSGADAAETGGRQDGDVLQGASGLEGDLLRQAREFDEINERLKKAVADRDLERIKTIIDEMGRLLGRLNRASD